MYHYNSMKDWQKEYKISFIIETNPGVTEHFYTEHLEIERFSRKKTLTGNRQLKITQ